MVGTAVLNRQTDFLEQALDLIEVLFLGCISQLTTQPYRDTHYSQGDCSQRQQSGTSRYPSLFSNYFLAQAIRTLLPRSPTGEASAHIKSGLSNLSPFHLVKRIALNNQVGDFYWLFPGLLKALRAIRRLFSFSPSMRGI